MKGKVLLATVYYQPNYGSVLQAYATQYIFEKLGYETLTINCNIINKRVKKRKILYYLKNIIHKDIFLGQVKRYSIKWRKLIDASFRLHMSDRDKAFQEFRKEKIHLSKAVPLDKIFMLCEKNVDAVIVGSDQLWLPSNITADFFTLNYVPENIKKISYGTSFGISELPEKIKVQTARFLERLAYISVREKSGVKIVSELSDKEVTLVCDPTLLLGADEWISKMSKGRIIKDKYIFCYFLGANPAHRDYAKKLAEKRKCKIVNIPHLEEYIKADEKYADYSLYDSSPLEFLNLVYFAEHICTDSFHGTVFSIIFNKSFNTFRRFKKTSGASTNNRIDSLMELCGLKKQIIEEDELDKDFNINIPDYEQTNRFVNQFRTESLQYLYKALEGEE